MPTLLSLCGIDVPSCVQGTDLSQTALHSNGDTPDSVLLADVFPCHQRYGHEPWRAIRTSRWLYARYPDRPWLLYDMAKDPYQIDNLSDSTDHQSARTELDVRLQDWLTKLHDPFEDRMTQETRLQAGNAEVLDSIRMYHRELHRAHLRLPLSTHLRIEDWR